jgi:hypothetical protein
MRPPRWPSPAAARCTWRGRTYSTNFPNTAGGAQASHGGGFRDAFVARLNASLTSNLQSTYLGGSGDDDAYALAIGPAPTRCTWRGDQFHQLPPHRGGAQASYGGGSRDAFVARLTGDLRGGFRLYLPLVLRMR